MCKSDILTLAPLGGMQIFRINFADLVDAVANDQNEYESKYASVLNNVVEFMYCRDVTIIFRGFEFIVQFAKISIFPAGGENRPFIVLRNMVRALNDFQLPPIYRTQLTHVDGDFTRIMSRYELARLGSDGRYDKQIYQFALRTLAIRDFIIHIGRGDKPAQLPLFDRNVVALIMAFI